MPGLPAVSIAGFLVIAVAVVLASALQASIGFGMGMLAAPIVALVDPSLLPGTLIVLAVVVTVLVVLAERQHVDLTGTGWAMAGRVPGSVVGALLVATLPQRGLALLLAAVVLLGVAVTSLGWAPAPRRTTLVAAGGASGVLGTATSIGGPPMALVWQGKEGPGLRGTMSGFFLVGSLISIATLAVAGAITTHVLLAVAWLAPLPVLGWALSLLLNRHLDKQRLRRTAIVVSALGAAVLVVQQLV
ncbi:sulfite exporter TauE/SafE family protein [uncultured Nocardioides sp.]|uniref:sulfite exporter TauE/SafE family protein n=1 Tax=uncultured Nocardioides sp. TaxID=198441 RepID=UPI0026101BBC|nr:sulfite exporter TauE/SafE family protein [uncultured Nocardioides sp.]